MKNRLPSPIRIGITLLTVLFFNSLAHATLFTVTNSGNFSNPATWGGTVPPTELKEDQILVPAGLTLNLDVDVFMNGTPVTVEINGTLTAKANTILTASWGHILGTGSIALDNFEINGGSTLQFDGNLTVKTLTNGLPNFDVVADISVVQSLFLNNGTLTLLDKGSLAMGIGADIVVTNGSIVVNGGSLLLDNAYNVNYTGESSNAGAELTGTGLNNVLVNVQDSASQVVLASSLKVKGTLNLLNGTLILNGHDLRIEGHLGIGGAGAINSNNLSNIVIETNSSTTGYLKFIPTGNTVNNLTINIKDGSNLIMDSDLKIAGILEFKNGKLDIGNYRMTAETNALILGTKLSSYIITDVDGILSMHVNAGAGNHVLFPVGTETLYAPAQLSLEPGSGNGILNLNVSPNVWEEANAGKDLSLTQPLVDATWKVSADNPVSNLNLTAELMWPAAAEVNGFDRTKAYGSSYSGSKWDKVTPGTSSTLGSGLYSIKRTGLTSLTPLAVFDQSAVTAVHNFTSSANYSIYPNPAISSVTVNNTSLNSNVGQVVIFDLNGKMVKTSKLNNPLEVISLEGLNPGSYILNIIGKDINEVKQLIKE